MASCGCRPGRYVFAERLCLERFDDEALLLVVGRDRLLTVNAAAADLFESATRFFIGRPFSLQQGKDWLSGHYDLDDRVCVVKTRELLAFALKQGLVRRAGESE